MDLLQDQIANLHSKVDALHTVVEQLNTKIADTLTDLKAPGATSRLQFGSTGSRYIHSTRSFDPSMEHKDVLVDTGFSDSDSHGGESTLSPEIQIQRLTAQLTAAYNRIAALEEQLLAQRVH